MKVNQDSVDLTKEKETESDINRRGDFTEELAMRSADLNHRRYGKMKVVYESDRVLITLGPDCTFLMNKIYAS